MNLKAEKQIHLTLPLVRNVPNGQHTVEIVANGDGEVAIEGFYVFQPPEN